MHTINWCNWLVYYDNEDDDVDAIQTREDAPGPLLQLHKLYPLAFTWIYSICMASGFAFNHN